MGSDQNCQLEKVIELKGCAEQFFNLWKDQTFKIPGFSPLIQSVHLQHGHWGKSGSILFWIYTLDGESKVFKSRMEFEEEKMEIRFIGLKGDPMNMYKVFIPSFAFEPKLPGSLANISIEFVKVNEYVPDPHDYVDFIVDVLTQIDDHIFQSR